MAGDLVFAMQLSAETRDILHSSAIFGSGSPQTNNRKGNYSSHVRDPMSNTTLPII